jgi:hypothetical protein
MRTTPALLATLALVSLPNLVQAAPPLAAKAKKESPPPLPEAQARLWVIAPETNGPWILRIDNEGTVGLRIPADVRLLRLEVETGEPKAKPVKCAVPSSMRPSSFPEPRALLLAPGASYVEQFDPRLFCFGKNADAIKGGAVVRSRFGWETQKKTGKKPPEGPFAAETTEREPTVAPVRELLAPAIVLSYDEPKPDVVAEEKPAEAAAKPAGDEPRKTPEKAIPPLVDERAGRLEVKAPPFVDASSSRGITITVTSTNAGKRPITVALRPWMFSFHVVGPFGKDTICGGEEPRGSLPRDAFKTLKPDGSSAFTVLLGEICPRDTFERPGLYRVTPKLRAGETSPDLEAYTATVKANKPTLIRLASGPEPFYPDAPKALPPLLRDADAETEE